MCVFICYYLLPTPPPNLCENGLGVSLLCTCEAFSPFAKLNRFFTKNVHIAQRLTSNGMMDIFIPTSSPLSQPHDAINSIIREINDEDCNISKLVENNNITAML